MVQETISIFEEKVRRLEKSSLWDFITSTGWKASYDFEFDRLADDAKMPDLESLEAYILNLRFFFAQNSEPTSLHNMASLYDTCKMPRAQAQFKEIRNAINQALDREIWFKFNGEGITYRKLFEGMMYSKFAHAK